MKAIETRDTVVIQTDRCNVQSIETGIQGGPPGESSYKIALNHGFVGTEEEWLESLRVNATEEDNGKILTNDGDESHWVTIEEKLNTESIVWDLGEL